MASNENILDNVDAVISDVFLEPSSDDEDFGQIMDLLWDDEDIPKVKDYIPNVVHYYTDERFQQFFRLRRDSCYALIDRFHHSPYCPHAPNAESAEKHILSFLRFAGNKLTLRGLAELFNTSESTAYAMINRVIKFLNAIAPDIIVFPNTEEERQEKAQGFLEIGNIDGIVGCIDGSYLTIRTPVHKLCSVYNNRHHEASLTLQAICDSKQKFLDCFTGTSGRMHDARVYEMSYVKRKVEAMGREYHILGDGAYPLSVNVLTPYRNFGDMTAEQTNFNAQFSRCRVKIENAFGNLKGRFRQLLYLDLNSVEKISEFIIAFCVLHNLCIDNDDLPLDNMFYEEDFIAQGEDEVNQENRRARHLGVLKRDEIASLL